MRLNALSVRAMAGLFIGWASAEPMTLVAAKCKMIAMYVLAKEP
jgi:hypothetical protein